MRCSTRIDRSVWSHLLAILLVGGTVSSASADDLFTFSLIDSADPANSLIVSGNSLPNLAEDFADLEGSFASFNGVAFSASASYAGVNDAVAFTYDPTGGANGGELLTITNLEGFGPIAPFDEANGDLGNQLKDFFLKDNPDAVSSFLQAVAAQSLIAVTDGNPMSTTARSAKYKYDWFGLNADMSPTDMELFNDFAVRDARRQATRHQQDLDENGEQQPAGEPALPAVPKPSTGWKPRVHFEASTIEAGPFKGHAFDLWIGNEVVFNEHVSLHLGSPLAYTVVEGADVFKGGLHLDVPVRLVIPEPGANVGWTWQVTPGVATEASGSYQYASGGLMLSAGVVNRVTADLPRGWSITAAQSLTFHRGQDLEISGYSFDPGVKQQILKIGGKVSKRIGDKGFIFAGATWTDFLDDAGVDTYWSPTAGIGFQFRSGGVLSIGYDGDIADDFTRHGARIDLSFSF